MVNHPNRSKAPFHCAWCDKPATKHGRTVFVGSSTDTIQRHEINSTYRHIYPVEPLSSIADCRRHTNMQVISVQYGVRSTVRSFSEWDGERWSLRNGEFCSGTCTENFARAAFRAGYRRQRKEV